MSRTRAKTARTKPSYRMNVLSAMSQAASDGPWSVGEKATHILGPETPDDPRLYEIVARAPAIRRGDGDRRRQWQRDRAFIVACVNEIRLQLAEADARSMKLRRSKALSSLRDMLGDIDKDSIATCASNPSSP